VDVDRVNQERLDALPGAPKRFIMHGTGAPPLIESLKRGCLSPETLVLKEGAVVMGTKNIPALGIANGTLGTVIGFERGSDYPIIETHDGREITVSPAEWAVEEGGKARAKVTQVPLRLAWAITVHKSQGMSMDAAAIDLSRAFEYGQGYVALSRVRTLAGLHVLGWSENALVVHPQVASMDEEFRAASEEAADAFAALEASGERETLAQAFVKASGGQWEAGAAVSKARKGKGSTYDETLRMLEEGMTLAEVAAARSLTYGTVCGHAQKLVEAGKLPKDMLRARLPEELEQALPRIHDTFRTQGSTELTPAFASLDGAVSFDDLRLARVLYDG
jgi:hypothetical protein